MQIKHLAPGLPQQVFFFFPLRKVKYKYRTSSDLEKALSQNNRIETCLSHVNKYTIKHAYHFLKYELKTELRRKKKQIHLISLIKGIPTKETVEYVQEATRIIHTGHVPVSWGSWRLRQKPRCHVLENTGKSPLRSPSAVECVCCLQYALKT